MKLRIDLAPVAKARARTVLARGKAHSYTPGKTHDYEEALRWLFKALGITPIAKGVPIKLVITFYLQQPKRSKYDWPVGRPDLDNLVKGLTDAGNGILWHDDSQLVDIYARKRWTEKQGYSEIEVEVLT